MSPGESDTIRSAARAPCGRPSPAHAREGRLRELIGLAGVDLTDRGRDRSGKIGSERIVERVDLGLRQLDQMGGERRDEHGRGSRPGVLHERVRDQRRPDQVDPEDRVGVGHARGEADHVHERPHRTRLPGGGREPRHRVAIDDVAHHAARVVTLGGEGLDLPFEVLLIAVGEQHAVRVAETPGDRHGHPAGADDDREVLARARVRPSIRFSHHVPP